MSWVRHAEPFEGFTTEGLLETEELAVLDGLFDKPQDWELHQSFYECFMAEVTGDVPEAVHRTVHRAASELTGMPLTHHRKVTAQRMEEGHQARVHSDRPLLGFEAVRVVLQLSEGWQPGDGGVFLTHPDADGREVVLRRPPRRNQAFAFALRPGSFHAVTPTRRRRHTMVFNHWHAGNTPKARSVLLDLCGQPRFADLPQAADRALMEIERVHEDELVWRAGLCAWLLHTWGCEESLVVGAVGAAVDGSTEPHTLLALWVATLVGDAFHVDAWQTLATALRGPLVEPAEELRALLFPVRE